MSGAHSPRQKAGKGIFGAGGLSPVVKVTSPTGNYQVTATGGAGSPLALSATVTAAATATDNVVGSPLPGSPSVADVSASLQWVSDKDGLVGTGAAPTLTLTTLGQHVITVTAVDGSPTTQSGSAKLYVNVVAG